MPTLTVTRDNWQQTAEAVRIKTGKDLPLWQCALVYYNLCLHSIITPQTVYLWNTYIALDGTKRENFESYQRLPVWYVDACSVIENETSRIEKERINNG